MTEPERTDGRLQENELKVEHDGGVEIVLMPGEHDLTTAASLNDRLAALVDGGSPVVIDLSQTSFIDSSILRVLLEARRLAHEAGIGFDVAAGDGTGEGVTRVLSVTGLDSTLPVFSSREDAVKKASSGPGA
ncbi:MAG: hypothetical protein QOG09_1640 [Solirubrobacterales bacterium]|jgi:anti-anti-sigma factor|nr:hypothetical protein [Solirubrobacterales bacterium]MDX6653118.1 hypothetical protein [Solirubrobacterales bacterium]MDX6663538.1 hypothetical protein [Solirubrobacterales bacterium]